MECKICGCEGWHFKGEHNGVYLFWRCCNCNHIQKAPGVIVKILKERLQTATGKELRDIKYLLKRKSGITIIGVKVVGICSKCRKEGDEIPMDKDGKIIEDKEISCVGCAL